MSTTLCDKCQFEINNRSFKKHNDACDGSGPRRAHIRGICKYCGEKFPNRSVGAHTILCPKNPSYSDRCEQHRIMSMGRRHTDKTRQKLKDIANRKICDGTWHYSFSKSRTHLYRGIKLYGTWELKYAIYLDSLNIVWERPIECFSYVFDGKVSKYTPDFYLPDEDIFVEIKGYKTARDEAKWVSFPHNLRILQGTDLVDLGILNDSDVKKTK